MRHTPGPWKANVLPGTEAEVRTIDGLFIARCGPVGLNGAEHDARFIAMLPDMREALVSLVTEIHVRQLAPVHDFNELANGPAVTKAKALLAKLLEESANG